MIECNCMIPVMNYGSSASYKAEPTPEQIANGVIPLDSLPAAWWNCMWSQTNTAVNQARQELGQLIVELNNVLCNAGVCPQCVCTDQLYQSIEKIRQTLGNATTAGAVKSSSDPSAVAIDEYGYMSVNCLGNAASLTTAARTVVGAINELKSTYDQCFTDTATVIGGKAPTSHASSATTYGVGSADNYGHLKISDTYTSVLAACSGVAASQKAVACVYAVAAAAAAGNVALGNTAGCALDTASAGTATTSARSDHVHPKPAITSLSGTLAIGHGGTGATTAANARTNLGLGSAAVCSTRVGGSVTHIPYSGNDGCPLLTSNFLAYWNGAYSGTGSSNLRYYCGGAFGTAAACAATAFRSCTWTPTCVACARCANLLAYTASNNNKVLISCGSNTAGFENIGYSAVCPMTFNPATGVLTVKCLHGCASSASSARIADCTYTQLGLCYSFINNCNKTICGVCICCTYDDGGCVCFINCSPAPRILYYQRFASGGWSCGGGIILPGQYSNGSGCWACYPSCNFFTIYQFSNVSP